MSASSHSVSPSTVLGGAYQTRRLDFENFHDIAITSEAVRSAADESAPIICAELQTGVMRDRPRLYASDVDLLLKTSAANGLNGLNCYMFSGGVNLPGMGCLGSVHDWQAPVSLDGSIKPHFSAVESWGRFVRKFGAALADTKKVVDTAFGFYLPYFATEYFSGAWSARVEFLRQAYFFDGIGRLLVLANVHFSITDLLKETAESLSGRGSLCVFSLEFMDEKTQELLAGYVNAGGKLLIGPILPKKDLSGKSCEILIKSLDLSAETQAQIEMVTWNGFEFLPDFPIQVLKGSDHVLARTAGGAPCAILGNRGRGRWLAYGFGLLHNYDYQVEMLKSWLAGLGVRPNLSADPWDLQAVARWKDDHGFLFIFNYHDQDKSGVVSFAPSWEKIRPFHKRISLARRTSIVIPLKLKDKKIMEVK